MLSQRGQTQRRADRGVPFTWRAKRARLTCGGRNQGRGPRRGSRDRMGWPGSVSGVMRVYSPGGGCTDVFGLQKLIFKKREGGGRKRRKEKRRGEKEKNTYWAHTPSHAVFFHALAVFILPFPASLLSIPPSPYTTREPGVRSFALREPRGVRSVEKHRCHKASTSFTSRWQKSVEGTSQRMHFHVPEVGRGSQPVWFAAAHPTLTDTMIGNPDQRLLLGRRLPELLGLGQGWKKDQGQKAGQRWGGWGDPSHYLTRESSDGVMSNAPPNSFTTSPWPLSPTCKLPFQSLFSPPMNFPF